MKLQNIHRIRNISKHLRNIRNMYHDQDRDAMTSLQMHLEPPVSGGPKILQGWKIVAKESKQVILIHFGHRMTSDKPRWPTQRWRYLQHQILFLARTESKKNSRRGLCHQYATVTQSHHHRRRTLSISTTWEPASGTAIPPQPREVTRLRSQHISL